MNNNIVLTLIWVGFLGVRFEVRGVKLPPPPCLKLVRITLVTSNLARKYTPICSFRNYSFYYLGPLSFADVTIFLQKNSVFCPKKYLYSKQECENCVRNFLVLFSVFVRQKITITENITFRDSVSGIRPRDAPNWPKIQKMTMMSQFSDMASFPIFLTFFCFSCQFYLLAQVSCQYHHWFWK